MAKLASGRDAAWVSETARRIFASKPRRVTAPEGRLVPDGDGYAMEIPVNRPDTAALADRIATLESQLADTDSRYCVPITGTDRVGVRAFGVACIGGRRL